MTRVIRTPIDRTPWEVIDPVDELVELSNDHGARDDDVARQLELADDREDNGDDLVELANGLADVLDADDDADPRAGRAGERRGGRTQRGSNGGRHD